MTDDHAAWKRRKQLMEEVTSVIRNKIFTPERVVELKQLSGPQQAVAAEQEKGKTGWKVLMIQSLPHNKGFRVHFKRGEETAQQDVVPHVPLTR